MNKRKTKKQEQKLYDLYTLKHGAYHKVKVRKKVGQELYLKGKRHKFSFEEDERLLHAADIYTEEELNELNEIIEKKKVRWKTISRVKGKGEKNE